MLESRGPERAEVLRRAEIQREQKFRGSRGPQSGGAEEIDQKFRGSRNAGES